MIACILVQVIQYMINHIIYIERGVNEYNKNKFAYLWHINGWHFK